MTIYWDVWAKCAACSLSRPLSEKIVQRKFPTTDKYLLRSDLTQRWGRPVELRDLGGYLGRNQVFAVRDGEGIVKLFHNEAEIRCRREIEAYSLLNTRGLPIPQLRDFGTLPDGTPWIYLSYSSGVLLESVDTYWDAPTRSALYREVGALLAAIHNVSVQDARALRFKSAHTRFTEAAQVVLQRTFAEHGLFVAVSEQIAKLEAALPLRAGCFVHRDASARNILVEKRRDLWQIAALIDFEMALIGDPMEDLAKIAFKDFDRIPESRAAILDAYAAHRPFVDEDSRRFSLCLFYLGFEIARWAMDDDPPFYQQVVVMLGRVLDNDPLYTLIEDRTNS